jgi:uncharacterized protein (DUF433 family)
MKHWDRITVNPGLMNGQPCVRGMRLTVRRVLQRKARLRIARSLLDPIADDLVSSGATG